MSGLQRLLWFTVAGAAGYVVDVGVLLLLQPQLGPYGARAVSFLAAASFTWVVNRSFAFAGLTAPMSARQEYVRYLLLMLIGGTVNNLAYVAVVASFGSERVTLALAAAAGSLSGLLANYLAARRFLYRRA